MTNEELASIQEKIDGMMKRIADMADEMALTDKAAKLNGKDALQLFASSLRKNN